MPDFIDALVNDLLSRQQVLDYNRRRMLVLDGKGRDARTPAEEAELKRLIGPIGEDLFD